MRPAENIQRYATLRAALPASAYCDTATLPPSVTKVKRRASGLLLSHGAALSAGYGRARLPTRTAGSSPRLIHAAGRPPRTFEHLHRLKPRDEAFSGETVIS